MYPISIHPQVSVKPKIMLMHEQLIEWINQHAGVEWCTFEEVARQFRKGEIRTREVLTSNAMKRWICFPITDTRPYSV